MKGFIESLKSRVGRGETTETDEPAPPERNPSTTLYSCPECETTFISEGLQSCPQCDGSLDTTPDEYELGIGPGSPASGGDPRSQ